MHLDSYIEKVNSLLNSCAYHLRMNAEEKKKLKNSFGEFFFKQIKDGTSILEKNDLESEAFIQMVNHALEKSLERLKVMMKDHPQVLRKIDKVISER